MAWAEIKRRNYQRNGLRYATNTANEEWAVIEPLMPQPVPVPVPSGRTHETKLRGVVRAIFYIFCIAQSGCQLAAVRRYFYAQRDNGVWQANSCAVDGDAGGCGSGRQIRALA